MKTKNRCLIILLILVFCNVTCMSNIRSEPKIEFEKRNINFGRLKLKPNQQLVIKFYFKNTGDTPLIIFNVSSSCSCTILYWNKSPIVKDTKDYIQVKYIVKDKGFITKSINVSTNTHEKEISLRIKGEII